MGILPFSSSGLASSQVSFLRDVEWLSDLKFRLSYGVTGSTAISPYSTQNTLRTENVVFDKIQQWRMFRQIPTPVI